jgi:molybdate transport system permease protein
MDLAPIWLSLRVASLATVLTLVAGCLSRGCSRAVIFQGAMSSAPRCSRLSCSHPPSSVTNLLMLIGRRGPLGRVLAGWNIELAFTWRAAVVAAAVGSIALLIKTVQVGFESIDHRLEQAAQTLGRSDWSIFWTISAPLAWRSILAGTVLAFCRALGDFGITLMVAGDIPGVTQTMPLAIYDHVQANELHSANVLAMVSVAFVVVLMVALGRAARLRY